MRLEPKPAPSLAATLLYPIAAVAATLVIASLLVLAAGASPFSVFYLVAKGAAGSQFALMETLTRATPLIFTGLAVAVAFRAKLWNIGAEAHRVLEGAFQQHRDEQQHDEVEEQRGDHLVDAETGL